MRLQCIANGLLFLGTHQGQLTQASRRSRFFFLRPGFYEALEDTAHDSPLAGIFELRERVVGIKIEGIPNFADGLVMVKAYAFALRLLPQPL